MSNPFSAKVNLLREPKGNLLAFATVFVQVPGFDAKMALNGYRVINGQYGLFVAAPSTKSNKTDPQTGRDIWYEDIRVLEEKSEEERRGPAADALQAAVLEEFGRANAMNNAGAGNSNGSNRGSRGGSRGGDRPRIPQDDIPF